jgi:putative hydroxymethylpyrimidine transport system ATP-binding protein
VLENVVIGQRLKGETPNIQRAADILAAVGLNKNLQDRPATLSGGMRQRVALARTLMEDAPVILVDEPFSALDAITRHKLQALLCELTSDRTVLMITHDPMEALRMSDKIIVLSGSPAKPYQIDPLTSPRPRELTDEGLRPRYEKIMALLDMSDKGAL